MKSLPLYLSKSFIVLSVISQILGTYFFFRVFFEILPPADYPKFQLIGIILLIAPLLVEFSIMYALRKSDENL